jgi:hypothetical protein
VPALNADQIAAAVADLYVRAPYAAVNRRAVDPVWGTEPRFALFSYIPSPTAVADTDGLFGVAKVRGVFFTQEEADKRAEQLVRDVDSANSIFSCLVGVPFPIATSGFARELKQVDVDKAVDAVTETREREKQTRDRREMRDIEKRREALLADVDAAKPVDPQETYGMNRVKLAQLRVHLAELTKKTREARALKARVIERLRADAADDPRLESNYMEKVLESRRAAHIPVEMDLTGYMLYMSQPIDADDDDEEERNVASAARGRDAVEEEEATTSAGGGHADEDAGPWRDHTTQRIGEKNVNFLYPQKKKRS